MNPGDLVKYKNRYSWTGVDREDMIGIVLEKTRDDAATNSHRNDQVLVNWNKSLFSLGHTNHTAWWCYVDDLVTVVSI